MASNLDWMAIYNALLRHVHRHLVKDKLLLEPELWAGLMSRFVPLANIFDPVLVVASFPALQALDEEVTTAFEDACRRLEAVFLGPRLWGQFLTELLNGPKYTDYIEEFSSNPANAYVSSTNDNAPQTREHRAATRDTRWCGYPANSSACGFCIIFGQAESCTEDQPCSFCRGSGLYDAVSILTRQAERNKLGLNVLTVML